MEENESVEVVQRLASPQARLGAYLADIGLAIVTLFIGWFIWSMFTWQTGQTPAKRLMRQVVVDARTNQPFTWVKMLLREAVVKWAAGGIASGASNGITFVIDSLFIFRDDRETVHDMIVQSKVIQL
ncbi:MAG: RDD family protein [Actinomycetota bacterium]